MLKYTFSETKLGNPTGITDSYENELFFEQKNTKFDFTLLLE